MPRRSRLGTISCRLGSASPVMDKMAYVVVEKRVYLTTRDSTGAAQAERTRFAWLSVYEKQDGQWRLSAIASTDRPDSP